MNLRAQMALDRLYPLLNMWIFYGGKSDKAALFEGYEALPAAQKLSWDQEVARAFEAFHHSDRAIMYRRVKPGGEIAREMRGASVTTEKPSHGETIAAFTVRSEDVLAHHAQNYTPLASRAFGHEFEVILKPDARPVFLGYAQ